MPHHGAGEAAALGRWIGATERALGRVERWSAGAGAILVAPIKVGPLYPLQAVKNLISTSATGREKWRLPTKVRLPATFFRKGSWAAPAWCTVRGIARQEPRQPRVLPQLLWLEIERKFLTVRKVLDWRGAHDYE